MNEQLQAELLKFVLKINSGVDFMSDQIPDVLNQLLFWHGLRSFICFLLFVTLIVCCYVATYYLHKHSKIWGAARKEEVEKILHATYDPSPYIAMWISPLILTTLAFFIGIMDNLIWLQVWLTPKAWLIDYISGGLKG